MKMKKEVILPLCAAILISLVLSSVALAGQVTIQLIRTSSYSRIDFDEALIMVWSGDVVRGGDTIGEFNASLMKTVGTGVIGGYVIQYDIVVPGTGPIGEFLSIRTNHITTGPGADHGTVFATSPAWKLLFGATVTMDGEDVTIVW